MTRHGRVKTCVISRFREEKEGEVSTCGGLKKNIFEYI